MNPRYRIFYSWQSDNNRSKSVLDKALDDVVKQLKQEGIYVSVEQGGGGLGFISIEDSVRIKIRRCDIFVGDITPVGNVSLKGKLLPNANVMYEMGVATECMHAERILAVAQKGEWKIEDMPFDFRQYPMLLFDSEDGVQRLYNELHKRIKETNKLSRIANGGFFSSRLVNRNIDSGKYLPDTFVENRSAKDKARLFLAPAKMYSLVFERFERMNFDHYNKIQKLQGKNSAFKLNIKKWDIKGKAIDMDILRGDVESLYQYIMNKASLLNRNNHAGWTIEHLADDLAIMNKQLMLVTSAAGHGKTNFVCDLIKNVLM